MPKDALGSETVTWQRFRCTERRKRPDGAGRGDRSPTSEPPRLNRPRGAGCAAPATMERLERAIAERGGQRRARPYVAAQLRRLRNAG